MASTRKHSIALTAIAAVALLATPVLSATVALDDAFLQGGDGVRWDMDNAESSYDQCVIQNEPALEIDAGFPTSDVFDGGISFQVGDKAFYDSNGNGQKGGKTIKAGPEDMGPLDATLLYKTYQDMPVLRSLLRLKNTSNQTVRRSVYFDSAHGTDFATRATQSGDHTWTKGDRWALFADYGEPSRPWVSYAFFGPGNPARRVSNILYKPWESDVGDGEDCVTVQYRVTIPAKATRYVAVLTRLVPDNKTLVQAKNQAREFNGPQGSFFVGLSDDVKSKIVNWDL